MKPNQLLSLVLALAFVLAACSPAATATAVPPTDAPAEPAAAFPTGKFAAVNNTEEAYQFREDGAFEYYYGSGMDPVFVGVYSVDGDRLTVNNPAETNPKCQGEATYQWFFVAEKLTFFPVGEDTCEPRSDSFSQTYTPDTSYIPEMKISARDFSYIAPKSVRSGWVRVILTNSGAEPHHVQFLRLNDGVTVAQFEETLKQGEGPALAMTKQVGGVGAVHPGGVAQAVLNLPAGEYVLLCFIPSPSDSVAHHVKGMIKSLTVRDESGYGNEPSADLTLKLKDFAFDMPESLSAGLLTIQVSNEGPEPHEFNILRLEEGKTVSDVMAFLNGAGGPPPFTPVGGMNGLDVGAVGYAELNLTPGTYVAICNIPSPKAEGHPHFTLGMIKQFTVQ